MIEEQEILWRGKKTLATFCREGKTLWAHINSETYKFEKESSFTSKAGIFHFGPLKSPMPGKIQKVAVMIGDAVEANQTLIVLEAMKMEYMIKVPQAARVTKVLVGLGQQVKEGQVLLEVEEV